MVKTFQNGRISMDDKQSGQNQLQDPTSDCPGEKKKFRGNGQVTTQETAEEVEISIHSCHTILMKDLRMHWVLAKFG
jgi:hypothetical protein